MSRTTPLFQEHQQLGAQMVEFAGWDMPIRYDSLMDEHHAVRNGAGMFDVSHMLQIHVQGGDAAAICERLVSADVVGLEPGRARYTVALNANGGVIDDLIVTRSEDGVAIVSNAARRVEDLAAFRETFGAQGFQEIDDSALLALQGPKAAAVLGELEPMTVQLDFMQSGAFELAGIACRIARLGYTGEDGFEIALAAEHAEALARRLSEFDAVKPAGLGARDSLRLEAGLCLYGQELDEQITPIEAGLAWTIGKRRRQAANFPGADTILRQLADGAPKRLVGILPEGRAPARQGTRITNTDGRPIGVVTSGGFGPSLGRAVSMGYVETAFAKPQTGIGLDIRGKILPGQITKLPFVPHRYHKRS